MADNRCHRCLQPTPARARRCPHCGDMLQADTRRINLYVAIVLSIGVLAIIGFSLFLKPTLVDLDNAAGDGREQPAQPAPPPPKKPPLN